MTEVNSENLEKVSGGAKNTHSKIRRLGDKPIKRTCICCKESFSVLPWEPRYICNKCQLKTNNLPKVSPKNLEKISGGKAEVANGRARHFIYTCPICGKTRNVTRYGCFMTRFEPICSDCKSKYDNDKLSELWQNSTIKNCMVEIKDNKADTTESK